jgi:CopG family nickel-responsive transcriptional regulator
MNVEKISVSVDKELLKRLEEYMSRTGLGDRSRVVQLALRDFLDERGLGEEDVLGIISIVYEESLAKNALTELQHSLHHLIISTLLVHVNEKVCMEAIAVRGKRKELVELLSLLSKTRGVKKSKLVISTQIEDEDQDSQRV